MTALLLVLAAAAVLAALGFALRERRSAHRAHAETREARDEARQAREVGDTFFDLASHELRSPLSAIMGYHELLAEGAYGDLPEGADQALLRLGGSARHLLHLIDGVVELSRLRSGNVRPDRAPVDLAVLLSGVTEAFSTHAAERGIETRVRIPDRLPVVDTDRERLVRVLDLLLLSAVKHPADKSLDLEVDVDARAVNLSIHDTDIAVHAGTDDPALRLGLRLAIVASVARFLGGSLILHPPDGDRIRRLTLSIPTDPDRAAV